MAYAKVNNTTADNLAKVNNVAKANIANVCGSAAPASGASLWTIGAENGGMATAAASDLNAWTGYLISGAAGADDYIRMAYGKDGNGDPLWVCTCKNDAGEFYTNDDPTSGQGSWTKIDTVDLDENLLGVAWGNDVWVAVGAEGQVWRSTDGASWSLLDLSGVTGWANDVNADGIVTDGAGKWMFVQGTNVFLSTNDGSAWARVVDLSDASHLNASGYTGSAMTYTASRWCVYVYKSGNTRFFHAAASDPTSWTASTYAGGYAVAARNIIHESARRMAAGDGTVIIVGANDTSRSTDGGQDWTKRTNDLPRADVRDVATDGNGNWVAVHDSGFVAISTNNGDSWAEQTGNNASIGVRTRLSFPFNGDNILNLEAVAANVFLPV